MLFLFLVYPFSNALISKIEANKTTFLYENATETDTEINYLYLLNSFFGSINFKQFKVLDSYSTELFSGSLESSLSSKSPYFKLIGNGRPSRGKLFLFLYLSSAAFA